MKKRLRSKFDSRQYMVKEDFEVFYYSDLHFKSVGLHSHSYYEFYFFEEGSVGMEINETFHSLSPGDVLIIPPGSKHRAVIKDGEVPYRRYVFWISRSYFQSLKKQSEDLVYILKRAAELGFDMIHFGDVAFNSLRTKLSVLLEEINSNRFGKESRIKLCISDLMLYLGRTVYEMRHTKHKEGRSSYETLIAFIEAHLEEDLSLDRIAGSLFLSKYHISHMFRERTGMSVHQYIVKKRLEMASDYIKAGVSAQDAGQSAGFSDYSSFYRAFKKEYGRSPSEYVKG